MFDTAASIPALIAGVIVATIVLGPLVLIYRARAKDASMARQRVELRANRTRDILAASPDGIFLWDHGTGGITCSRRLADMLNLEAGTLARYDDIRACFSEGELQKLEQGVSLLRAKGEAFDVKLRRDGKTFQALGARALSPEGQPVADLVWLRPAAAAAPAGPRNASGLEDKHLTALLDALPIPLWLRDGDLNMAFMNRAAERAEGLDQTVAARAKAAGKIAEGEARITLDGRARDMHIVEVPLRDGGTDGGTIAYAFDHLGTAPSTAPARPEPMDVLRPLEVGVALFDADTTLSACNAAFADLWRLDADWLETRPGMTDLLTRLRELRRLPEVADFAAFRRQELSRFGGLDRVIEDEMHLPDDRTIRRRIGPVGDGGLVMTCEDVSGRLDLQRSIKSLDRVQRTTLENLREGIAVFGGDGRLRMINERLLALWELDADALPIDRRLPDVIETLGMRLAANDEPWPARKERIANQVLDRTPSTGKVELVSGRILAFANIPLPDGASLVSYGDITDSQRVEEALRERARTLAETDRMKTEFIANVAMEVRTPLNTITGFADMLRQEIFGELNRRQQEYTDGILETARRTMGVVADILDLATIEAGRMELDKDTVEIHAVLVSAYNLIKERARQKNIEIRFDCAPDIGWCVADNKRLTQATFNLLNNAVTFTPKLGHVSLHAERDGEWIEISVSDSGPGIPKAERERLFEPFSRLQDDEHSGEGPGLGLTIVKRFVELHGGGVMIRSNKARGTTVVCRLPIDGENAQGLAPFATDHAILEERAAE